MKIWTIFATILMIVFIGVSGWFYSQNSKLKTDLASAKTDLTSAQTAKAAVDKKIATANKKIQVLSIFFAGQMNTSQTLEAKKIIDEINDPTLNADWTAMENSTSGDNSGTKILQDLLTALEKDLK